MKNIVEGDSGCRPGPPPGIKNKPRDHRGFLFERGGIMLVWQSRVAAETLEGALELIRKRYGDGALTIRKCNIQPYSKLIWFEYHIVQNEPDPKEVGNP